VLSYDYTVLAGTQGVQNHRKTDRLLELAHRRRLARGDVREGGGAAPGTPTNRGSPAWDVSTFRLAAELVGEVPTVAVVSGYCFAGKRGAGRVCDVLIATEGASLGMGGPAMIAGGGLGEVEPGAVGAMSVQVPNGVVDLLVADDAAAVAAARRYLAYCGPRTNRLGVRRPATAAAPDPENGCACYPIRPVLDTCSTGSVLRAARGLRRRHPDRVRPAEATGRGARQRPHPPGGAIDAEAADKATRFSASAARTGCRWVSLFDTPGFMVGPEAERTATVRPSARCVVAAPSCARAVHGGAAQGLRVGAMPWRADISRLALTAAWPTASSAEWGWRGAVQLGYRAELTR